MGMMRLMIGLTLVSIASMSPHVAWADCPDGTYYLLGACVPEGPPGPSQWVQEAAGQSPVPVARFVNKNTSEHFYTADCKEAATLSSLGFQYEGPAFDWFPSGQQGLVPMYRFIAPSHTHFWTLSGNAEGDPALSKEGISGYVYPVSVPGSAPLFRLYNKASDVHFYTTNVSEVTAAIANGGGYNFEGIAAWVLPPAPVACGM